MTFENKIANSSKLLNFGFKPSNGGYVYAKKIVSGQFEMVVKVAHDNCVMTDLIDVDTNEAYFLHLTIDAQGAFVGKVRQEYNAVLQKITDSCFETSIFNTPASCKITSYIDSAYGDKWEFLWQKSPENAIVRRKDNQKWYAVFLKVAAGKLGLDGNEIIEVLNVRIKPDIMEKICDGITYFPGYHMNKHHWLSINLNKSAADEGLYRFIDESWKLAAKK